MRIKHTVIHNVKGRDYDLDLGSLNLITGPSWAGKTALLDGLKIGLLGYHPRLGKTNQVTWELAGGTDVMRVRNWYDDGRESWRAWSKKNETVTLKSELPREAFNIPPVLLDLSEYFNRTEADRVNYIFEQISLDEFWSDADFLTRMERLVGEFDSEAVPIFSEQADHIRESVEMREQIEQSIPEWMDKLVARYRGEWKTAKESAQRMQKALEASTQLSSQVGLGAIVFPCVREEIGSLRAEINRLMSESGSKQAKLKAAEEALENRVKTQRALEGAQDYAKEIGKLQAKIKEIGLKWVKFDAAAVDKSSKAWMTAKMEQEKWIEESKRISATLEDLCEEFDEKLTLKQCPFCKSKAKGWQKHFQADYQKRIEKLKADKTLTELEVKNRKVKLDAAFKADQKAREENKAYGLAMGIERQLMHELNDLTSQQSEYAQAKAALASLPEVSTEEVAEQVTKQVVLQAKIGQLNQQIAALDQAERKWNAQQADLANREKAKAELASAKAEQAVYDTIVKFLVDEQRRAMAKGFGVILAEASRLFEGILPYKLEFRDDQIGWQTPNGWASYRTFSGTEEKLALAALSLALARQSPFKVLLLDELGVIQPESLELKKAVMERLTKLVKDGTLDQVCVVDSPTFYEGEVWLKEWNVIEVKGC